jgi:dipeptidyl aminopeptidase/acylaminoacyl peptidase
MNRPLFAAALLASVSLSATAANARPITPEDVARIESVGTMAVSPDGARVAYTTASLPDVTKGEKDGTTRQVLKIATAPDVARAFLPEDISPGSIGFSPDGSMVTFLWTKPTEKRSLWGVPVDGGAYRKLAAIKDAGVRSYRFSPDGGTVYLLADPATDEQRETQRKAGFDAKVYEEELSLARMFAARLGADVDTAPNPLAGPGHRKNLLHLDFVSGIPPFLRGPGRSWTETEGEALWGITSFSQPSSSPFSAWPRRV